jgi:ubiquinone/menaquinone biosynthesis C-methylase UbiE
MEMTEESISVKTFDLFKQKGIFVREFISQTIQPKNLLILDLGAGSGGTSIILSQENKVVSFDLSLKRLKNQPASNTIIRVNGNATELPFRNNLFDLIILQDVIEHIPEYEKLLAEVSRVTKSCGYIYLSSPNKHSLINILSDPHWGVPFVALMSRYQIKKYFLKYFNKKHLSRQDIAQLFSLDNISRIFNGTFERNLNTKFAVKWVVDGKEGVIWGKFHRILLSILMFAKIDKILLRIANNNYGIVNKFFTPTFYFLLRKK